MTRKELVIFIISIPFVIVGVGVSVWRIVGPEQAFEAGLTAALVGVTAMMVYLTWCNLRLVMQSLDIANRQAETSRKMVEEMKETRLATSGPVLLQKAVFAPPKERYFSHFLIWNAGNGTAIEVTISLLKESKQPIGGESIPFLQPREAQEFRPCDFTKDEHELEGVKCYLVSTYMDMSHLTGDKVFNQTWLPFIIQKARDEGMIRDIELGEPTFQFDISENDLAEPFRVWRRICPT